MRDREPKALSKSGSRACKPSAEEEHMKTWKSAASRWISKPSWPLPAAARALSFPHPRAIAPGKARELVEKWVREGRAVYGVTTGFGALCEVAIPADQTRALQENILMSHAAGVGKPVPRGGGPGGDGNQGAGPVPGPGGRGLETLQALVDLLNSGVCPVVPEKGSVGASGDLAPMAHLALVLIGKGEAFYRGDADERRGCAFCRGTVARLPRGRGRACSHQRDAVHGRASARLP